MIVWPSSLVYIHLVAITISLKYFDNKNMEQFVRVML